MSAHVLYTIDRKPELTSDEKKRVAYLREKQELANSLGLTVQASALDVDIETIKRANLIATPSLSSDELLIWRAWLPTAYAEHLRTAHHGGFLKYYDFDKIPGPVLKIWQKHRESGLFQSFEIWTPEFHKMDPVLVGVSGTSYHLLARWGESDAQLISFSEIKKKVKQRWRRNQLHYLIVPAFFAGVITLFLSAVAIRESVPSSDPNNDWVLLSIPIGISVSIALGAFLRKLYARRDPLMQAIARHTTSTSADD